MAKKSALPPALRRYFQALGAKGGKTGGKARWAGVSAAERTRLAKAAVAAREAKRRKKT